MFIPDTIYEFLPEGYTIAAIIAMVVYPSLLAVFSGIVLTLVGLVIWRARKNYRFRANDKLTTDNKIKHKEIHCG
jgi:hypothetical protein